MKKEEAVLQRIKKDFTYISDPEQYESRDAWFVMKPKKALQHDYTGDCEDFALTVLFYLSDCKWHKFWWSLLSRKAKIRFCKVYGGGHAVLRYKGMYCDNIQPTFVTEQQMIDKGYEFSSWLYIPLQVAVNMLRGKLSKSS